MLPLDTTHLVLARQDVQELLLYGADKASLNDSKTEPVETTGPRVGKTVLRTMLVELLMFFAKTYKLSAARSQPVMVDSVQIRRS
jgi:uridine nucleosidase